MNELYCVLHKDPGYSRERAADFLAGEYGILRPEAEAAVRKSPGFLLENASLNKASAFNLRASACGFETVLIANGDLKTPPPAVAVSKIELKTEGFYYVSGSVKEHVSFETVRRITACAFDVEVPSRNEPAIMEAALIRSLRAGYFPLAAAGGGKGGEERTPAPPAPIKETVFLADILLEGTPPVRLRVPCDEQDYSGLGPKKTLSSFDNFRTLLDELSALAFGAGRNPFLEAFLKKEPLGRLKSPSPEAYERELAWLTTVLDHPRSEGTQSGK